MTEDELREWRANLQLGDRVGFRMFDWMRAGTLAREVVCMREPGERHWELFLDADRERELEEALNPASDTMLEPLPSPDTTGQIHIGWPEESTPGRPSRRRRSPARARRAPA
jgi:hypothetical protein